MWGLVLLVFLTAGAAVRAETPRAGGSAVTRLPHAWTFRPTVIVRKGNSQGSGTVIASVAGETLVLTAAHVAQASEEGPITVELHRYNLGVETTLPEQGWPLSLGAELAAADPAGDVAVLRVKGRSALPFVARLAAAGETPVPGDAVLSVGIDGGDALRSWPTRVRESTWFALDVAPRKRPLKAANRTERPFLITLRPPQPGRSGGPLFSEAGAVVGVCVGRVESERRGEVRGLFASPESVRKLLRDHDLEALVARSEGRSFVTTTRSVPARP